MEALAGHDQTGLAGIGWYGVMCDDGSEGWASSSSGRAAEILQCEGFSRRDVRRFWHFCSGYPIHYSTAARWRTAHEAEHIAGYALSMHCTGLPYFSVLMHQSEEPRDGFERIDGHTNCWFSIEGA